jgi:hypothetical protein
MCSHQGKHINGHGRSAQPRAGQHPTPSPPQDPAMSAAWHHNNGLALPDHLQTKSSPTTQGTGPAVKTTPAKPQVRLKQTPRLQRLHTPTSQWGIPRTSSTGSLIQVQITPKVEYRGGGCKRGRIVLYSPTLPSSNVVLCVCTLGGLPMQTCCIVSAWESPQRFPSLTLPVYCHYETC